MGILGTKYTIPFNPKGMAISWLGRQFARRVTDILDGLGEENVRKLVTADMSLVGLTDPVLLASYKQNSAHLVPVVEILEPEELYKYVPPEAKQLLDSIPNGKTWLIRQLSEMKGFILAP